MKCWKRVGRPWAQGHRRSPPVRFSDLSNETRWQINTIIGWCYIYVIPVLYPEAVSFDNCLTVYIYFYKMLRKYTPSYPLPNYHQSTPVSDHNDIDTVLTPITFYSKQWFLGWIVLFFGPLDFEFCFGRARITLSFSFLLHGLSDPEQIHGDVGTVVEGLIFCHYDWIASFRQPLYTYSSRLVVTRDIRGGLM